MKSTASATVLLLAFFLQTVLISGCDVPEGEIVEDGAEALYFESVASGHYAAFSDTTEMVVRTAEEWEIVRQQLKFVEEPGGVVDFDQVALLLVVLPVEESGFRIRFSGVERGPDVVLAYYEVEEPGEGCMPAYTQMAPFTVIAVRRFEAPVEFVRERSRYRCEHRRI